MVIWKGKICCPFGKSFTVFSSSGSLLHLKNKQCCDAWTDDITKASRYKITHFIFRVHKSFQPVQTPVLSDVVSITECPNYNTRCLQIFCISFCACLSRPRLVLRLQVRVSFISGTIHSIKACINSSNTIHQLTQTVMMSCIFHYGNWSSICRIPAA